MKCPFKETNLHPFTNLEVLVWVIWEVPHTHETCHLLGLITWLLRGSIHQPFSNSLLLQVSLYIILIIILLVYIVAEKPLWEAQ